MTPLQRYQQDLRTGGFNPDPAQQHAVNLTQTLYDELLKAQQRGGLALNQLMARLVRKRPAPIKGLYFWGGVGRGKTYIVDTFYECLPIEKKLRIHFHRFMQKVHHELKQLKECQNPLRIVADHFAQRAIVICFDEFHVADITDAMLLSGLLQALFEQGVTLVATSNEHPDQLYRDGLQRDRFLPAIDLLKRNTRVVNIDSGIDYRLRYLDKAEIYHWPLDQQAHVMLKTNFEHIAPGHGSYSDYTIEIEGRDIHTVCCGDGVVWFDFQDICDGPRGPADYIEIARQFQTVLIANVPQLSEPKNDQAKRFITLVDEFYDRGVKLILTAAVPATALYQGKRLAQPFKRTVSRLTEMQSHDYLARGHLPE